MDPIVPKPKPKHQKPQKAPWEDMHLRKKEDVAASEDVIVSDEPQAGLEPFEEYMVPVKARSPALVFNPF